MRGITLGSLTLMKVTWPMSHVLSKKLNLILNFILITCHKHFVKDEEYQQNKLQINWKTCRFLYRSVFFFCLQLVFILEQLHAITSVPPETPHEKWFQEKFGKCHSRILYPARRETVQKVLLVQKASWALELLSLS